MHKQIIAIVGAGTGVSAGIARKFGHNGYIVVLLARRRAALEELVQALRGEGIEAHGIVADAVAAEAVEEGFARVQADFGTPDVMVYNAGANTVSNPSELAVEDLIGDFTVNVAGALRCVQAVVPAMTERGSGTILFTGGMLALNPVASRASASIAKAGLRNLAFTLADEVEPLGITVGIVTIGGVVSAGTFFDPDLIAEAYWRFIAGAQQREVLYTDPGSDTASQSA